MNSHKSISEYKALAKEQLLGNYGLAISSFVVIFVIFYTITLIIFGAYSGTDPAGTIVAGVAEGRTVDALSYFKSEVATTAIDIVIGLFTALFFVGYLHILMGISTGQKFALADLFYGFKNNPDKVILIYAVLAVIRIILMLPVQIISFAVMTNHNPMLGLVRVVLLFAAYAVYIYLNVIFALKYLIYLDDPNMNVKDYYQISAKLMKGNKMKFVLIYLSLIGYGILSILSLGIGLLWVEAYRNMIIINFYRDITEIKTAADNIC